MKSPIFSIIIPVYNREVAVLRAVDSVLSQSFTDFELLLVDDFSSDNSLSVLSSLSDPRIVVLPLPENKGPAGARNQAIKHARGRYICFLDSDDEYEPEFLQEAFNKMQSSSENVGFIWTGVLFKSSSDQEKVKELAAWVPGRFDDGYKSFLHSLHIGTNSGITIKREVFEAVSLFDESLRAAEDTDFFLRASQRFQFDHIDKPLIKIYRDNSDRLSKNYRKIWDAYKIIIPKHINEIRKSKTLRLKYNYKMMWLSYRCNHFTEARKYFRLILKDDVLFVKAWLVLLIFELLGGELGARVHLKFAGIK